MFLYMQALYLSIIVFVLLQMYEFWTVIVRDYHSRGGDTDVTWEYVERSDVEAKSMLFRFTILIIYNQQN